MPDVAEPDVDRRRLSFGAEAEGYDRHRPGYPATAVAWLLAPAAAGPLRVLDLGAGTGLLSAAVAAAGHHVVGVEPDPGMRARLARRLGADRALDGSAEDIPLADGSVDAVVVGQAWHWFDAQRAPAEVARVLRPGGVLGVVWNVRDDSTPWVAQFEQVVAGQDSASRVARLTAPPLPPAFGPAETTRVRHTHPLASPADLVGLARSFSYVRLRPDVDAVLAKVGRLAERLPGLADGSGLDLPYLALCYRWPRR